MAGENEQSTSTSGAAANSSAGMANTEQPAANDAKMIPYERFAEVNRAKRDAETELERYRAADKKRQEAEDIAKGDFEKVLSELRPKADRAEALEKSLKGYLQAELADVPEAMRDLVPSGDVVDQLAWVKAAKAKGLFNPQSAPSTDAGARGDSKQLPKLSPLQRQMAAAAGMSEKEYAEYLVLGQQQSANLSDSNLKNLLGG